MTDSLSDDARLRATEEQMRRALGLHNSSPTQDRPVPPPASPVASSPQRRRFIRDGEVPVSVIRRDQADGAGTNKLDAMRQALSEHVAARKRAEHLIQEAQATIHDLQTKLAHERLARDEAIQRVVSEKQVVEQALQRVQEELAVERVSRQKVEQERDEAVAGRQKAEGAATGDACHPGMPRMRLWRGQGPRVIRRRPGGQGKPCRRLNPLPAAIR